jgi:hypothetical protein
MTDAQVEILIKAVDEASAKIDKVQKNVESANKKIEKSNAGAVASWGKTISTLQTLGNVANGIHNIFEIQEARTRNLENATDRLENATLRLKDAKLSLKRATEDVAISQKQIQLDMDIANRKRKEAIKVLEALKRAGDTTSDRYLETMDMVRQLDIDIAKGKNDLVRINEDLKSKEEDVTIATNNQERAQRSLEKTIGDNRWALVNMGTQALSVVASIGTLTTAMGGFSAVLGILTGPVGWVTLLVAGLVALSVWVWKNWDTMSGFTKFLLSVFFPPLMAVIGLIKDWDEYVQRLKDTWNSFWGTLKDIYNWIKDNLIALLDKVSGGISGIASKVGGSIKAVTGKKNDFVMRPGQPAVPFSSSDTLIGVKNPGSLGGASITITGNIYGTDPDEIADAIMTKLRHKISI